VKDPRDVRVQELSRGTHLGQKTLPHFATHRKLGVDHLQSDNDAKINVARFIGYTDTIPP
jgi:hypothetical protein